MKRALVLLSLVGIIVGEAPYHLPRPGPQAPALQYPVVPLPPPPPPQNFYPQQPSFINPAPAPQYPPQQPATSNFGYNYPAPNPNYIQPRPAPQPIHYQPAPPAPAPYYPLPAPAPHYHLPAPVPQPQPISIPYPAPIVYPQPSPVYGSPQIDIRSAPQPQYIAPQPAPQPQPLPQPIAPAPIQYQQQQYQQSGYSYQQPIQAIQPFQAQPINIPQQSNAFSSYQADSNQYSSNEQVHRDALDPIVVNRVQSIIKNDEHDVARNAGYQSLVSGVSLENAKPSVEILSFSHTSGSSSPVSSELSEQSGSSGSISSNFNFLPQTKPATSYGLPN